MINIIEHFWQFQPKNIEILPTVIKIGPEFPKAYFYSTKQKRVLRKKQHSCSSAIDVLLGGKQKEVMQLLLLRQQNTFIIIPELILSGQLYQILNKNHYNCMIISLQSNIKVKLVIECKYACGSNSIKVYKQCQWKEKERFWGCCQEEEIKDELVLDRIEIQMKRVLSGLLQAMKITEECCNFDVLMACDEQFVNLKIVWCNKFQWKIQNFYEINYKMNSFPVLSSNRKTTPKGQTQPKNQQKQDWKERVQLHFVPACSQETQRDKIEIKPLLQKVVKTQLCRGCQTSVPLQLLREVTYEQVVILRRRNKMSIMGLNQDYYNICSDCSEHLENLI